MLINSILFLTCINLITYTLIRSFTMKIFIARLPMAYQEEDIAALFAPYGDIITVNLIIDRETGRSKWYAFVEMPNDEDATNAISNLNQKSVQNKTLVVSRALERSKSNSGFNKGNNQKNNSTSRGNYGNNRNSGTYPKEQSHYNRGYSRGSTKDDADY